MAKTPVSEWRVWWMAAAWGHVGDVIGGVDVTVTRQEDVTEAPPLASIEANFGLLLPSGTGGWSWVCHEAVTAPKVIVSPRYTRSPSGAWLSYIEDPANGRDGHTLFRSEDGCSWPAVASLAGEVVPSADFDPVDPLSAWAVTATPESDNGIWASSDGGLTFAPAFAPLADRRFQSVVDTGDERWATATDEAGGRLFLWHASAKEPWAERELVGVPSVVARTDLRVLATGEPGEAWLVVDPFGADLVVHVLADGTWTVAYAPDGWINDGAWDGERLWVVHQATTLTSVDPDGATADHPAFPSGTNLTYAEGALWTAPASYLVFSMLARSGDDAASFDVLAYPDDVAAPLACPEESDQATVCAPLWDQLLPRIRGFDDRPTDTGTDTGTGYIPPHRDPDVGGEDGPSGCGCSGQAPATLVFPLLGFGLHRRGRRER